MSEQKQQSEQRPGIGGLPFGFGAGTFTQQLMPSPSSPSSPASPSSPTSPTSIPSATSPTSPTSTVGTQSYPPPHLGPGGLPLSPTLINVPGTAGVITPKHRHWGEKLWYETGTSYAVGFFGGGTIGCIMGALKPLPGANIKLRINSILNNAGRTSATYGNSFAVFAMIYSMTRSTTRWYHRRRLIETRPLPQVPYQQSDDKYEAFGVAVAGTITAYTRFSAGRSLALGTVLGIIMMGGLTARHKYVDQRGVKLVHI